MVAAITQVNEAIWAQVEECLTPLPEDAKESCLWHVLPVVVLLPAGIVVGSFTFVVKVVEFALGFFGQEEEGDPNEDFSLVLKDSRLWEQLGDVTQDVSLGEGAEFLKGVSTCTYQDSGAASCPNSQWAEWEKVKVPEENRSGKSADFFTLYQTKEGRLEIIQRLHALGVNAFRFSVEWSHIEPEEGKFNEVMLQVYVALCKELRDAGISPMITLHHFSEPQWFHQLGSFENEENIRYFARFAERISPALTANYRGKPLVEYFCTINEPNIEAFSRYVRGTYSPGVMFDFARAGAFLKGSLKAHTAAYSALKKLAPSVKVGVTHARLTFLHANPFLFLPARYLNRLVNDTVLNFFRTGDFNYKMPLVCNLQERDLKPMTDFVGLQYYVRPLVGFVGSTSYHEPMTAMDFREDPEGIYEAILEVHDAFQVPVIVTENGISTHDDEQRSRYISRALFAAQKAQEKIGELQGYFLWSMSDNFEWELGMRPQAFGAYSVREEGLLSAVPKKGLESFIRVAHHERAVV